MQRFATDRNKVIAELVLGKEVLDIGSVDHSAETQKRQGWVHETIRSSAASVMGLDYEEKEVRKLQKKGYDIICADATCFDLNCKSDVIVAGELLEHLLNVKGFLDCARRHLRPGGGC